MSRITTFLAAAGLALTMATAATAGTAYDNGGPDGVGGNEATLWIQAEDFSVGTDVAITGATVYLTSFSGYGSGFGNVEYWIFGDNQGSPSGTLANGSTFGTVTGAAAACCGAEGAEFSFDFNDAFNAVAGEQYWFGFHLGSGYEDRQEIYWSTTGFVPSCEDDCPTGFNNGHESLGGTLNNWVGNEQEHAFRLTSDVPEPASWALMILGFGAAGAALRRRRLVAA